MNRCSPTLPLPGLVIKEDPYLGRQMLRSFCHLQTPLFLDALQQVHPGLARQIPVQAIAYGLHEKERRRFIGRQRQRYRCRFQALPARDGKRTGVGYGQDDRRRIVGIPIIRNLAILL